jgi:beta-galactosidase
LRSGRDNSCREPSIFSWRNFFSIETLGTAGKPAKLKLTVERARLSSSWDDVAYLRASITDDQGTPVPDDHATLHFVVNEPGTIVATDNADNADNSGFEHPDRVALHGTAIAIVRATAAKGNITVTVSSEGLGATSVRLPIVTASDRY